jgi:anti-anti-sigma factor
MLTRAMRSTGAKIVLDLSRLDFVDSAGARHAADRERRGGQGQPQPLAGPSAEAVERVFAVTKFETLFTIER